MKKTLLPSLVSALLVFASLVLAAPLSKLEPAAEQEIKSAMPTDLKAFLRAKVTLLKAIIAANSQGNGTAIDVSFDAAEGKPVYKVKTYRDNLVWEGIVDAQSGKVIGAGKTTQESLLDEEDKAELVGLNQATTTLAQAVDTAEKRAGGKAMSAGS
jgi:uncharacterized membrane protein YkoI